jgi:hypothetical protein
LPARFGQKGVEGGGIEIGRVQQPLDLVGLEQTSLQTASHRGREVGYES